MKGSELAVKILILAACNPSNLEQQRRVRVRTRERTLPRRSCKHGPLLEELTPNSNTRERVNLPDVKVWLPY